MVQIPPEARELLESDALAHIVTINRDGSPHVSIVWVGLEGDEVVSAHLARYQKLANVGSVEQVAALEREFSDRFGAVPPELQNLLYALRIKIRAGEAGIESVATEDGQIVLRRFPGMRFDRQKLGHLAGDGVKIDNLRVKLNPKRLGEKWREVLEEVVGRVTI